MALINFGGFDTSTIPVHRVKHFWTVPELAERYKLSRQGMGDYLTYHRFVITPAISVTTHRGDVTNYYADETVKLIDQMRAESARVITAATGKGAEYKTALKETHELGRKQV